MRKRTPPPTGGRKINKKTGCHVVWQLAAPLCVVGLRVRAAGGNANNGTNAGASYTNANNTATNANANYSAPLNFAIKICYMR